MSAWRARLAWLLFAAWAALLLLPALQGRGALAALGVASLRSRGDLLSAVLRLLAWVAAGALRFAPLGLLAVLGLPDRETRWARLRAVATPALTLALAAGLLALEGGSRLAGAGSASPLAGLLAAFGVALGVAAGLAWRRGGRARLLFLPRLAALAALALALCGAAFWAALEDRPRAAVPVPITSEDKRRLFEQLRGGNPRNIPPGETRTLRLAPADLDRLSAWATAILRRGHGSVRLEGPGVASAEASLRLPGTGGRWLNLAATARVGVERGRLDLELQALRLGRFRLPGPALSLLSPVVAGALRAEPLVRMTLPSVEAVRVGADGVSATWGRVDFPHGALAGLLWGEERVLANRASVGPYLDAVLAALQRGVPGDGRFATALEAAFRLARERSRGGGAAQENRFALLALGAVLGHERIASLMGAPLDEATAARADALRRHTTVRGRADWVRHFTVSGALTVLTYDAPSDAAGLFKEEKDAQGGSGFSFGDLLADRAGTTFADRATRDEASAAALQERLAAGVKIDDLFPHAADLPEDIPLPELQARYGGVGGARFREVADEIERRVAACAAYRD
jgi:hypothetical protein